MDLQSHCAGKAANGYVADTRVRLSTRSEKYLLIIRLLGRAGDTLIREKANELRNYATEHKLEREAVLAFYNPPWTLALFPTERVSARTRRILCYPGGNGLKAMVMTLVATVAAIAIALSVFVLIGPERVWSWFGPADLGQVDFATLERRSSPNDALACTPEQCRAKIDIMPPVFSVDARSLRAAMGKALTSEHRLIRVHAHDASLTDRYVQRSAFFGFPDTIVIKFVNRPRSTSTVAIYSRSQLGQGDFGANKRRIERWLDKLKQAVPGSRESQ